MRYRSIAVKVPLAAVLAIFALLPQFSSALSDPFLGYDGPIYPNPVVPLFETWPVSMLEGDFDEDGIEDLIVIGAARTTILLGNGDCTFRSSTLEVFATVIGRGALGDFNDDNHQDLAISTGGELLVHLGNGDGTFTLSATLTFGAISFSAAVAVADFDEDGFDDILTGFFAEDPLTYFSGNGDGTFGIPTRFSSGGMLNFAVADFDEDQNLDFVANRDTPRLRLGDGNGGFVDDAQLPTGTTPSGILAADFDGDGHFDFATANRMSANVSIRLGNGDGTFAPSFEYPVGNFPEYLALPDIDADGLADLVVTSDYSAENYISILPGNGDGTFDPEVRLPTAKGAGPVIASDFDGDGRLDLAVASSSNDELALFRGDGEGSFDTLDPAWVRSPDAGGGLAIAFGELNGDSKTDVAVLSDSISAPIAIRIADGSGAFVTVTTEVAGVGPSDIAIADIDNDLDQDVLVSNFDSNTVSIVRGNGDGTFQPVISVPAGRDAVSMATGDFDGDDNVDLAMLNTFPVTAVRIMPGAGDGTFSLGANLPVGAGATIVETGDFDSNGAMDLVVLDIDAAELSVALGVGDGTFQPEVRYGLTPMFLETALTVLDLNADGHQDLLVPLPDQLVLYGNGDGTFAAATAMGVGGKPDVFAVGDVNGDGRTDLVGAERHVSVQLRRADLSFESASYFSGSVNRTAMLLTDTDSDGRLDVVTADADGILTLLNVEPTPFNFSTDRATLRWPKVSRALSYNVYRGAISGLTDLDLDGLPDLGYGECLNALDPDLSDTMFVDSSTPLPGAGFFYLISYEDGTGERGIGRTSTGLDRLPTTACP